MSTPSRSARRARVGARADVEADDERVRGGREVDVVLRDPADARVDDVDAHLRVLDLLELAEERLDRALDVALQDDVQVLHLACLEVVVQRLERDAPARALRELLAAQPLRAHVREVLRLALVLDDADELARSGWMVEAEHLDGLAGLRLRDLLAAVVVQRAHLAGRVACDRGVADAKRPAVDEHRRDRPATDVEP